MCQLQQNKTCGFFPAQTRSNLKQEKTTQLFQQMQTLEEALPITCSLALRWGQSTEQVLLVLACLFQHGASWVNSEVPARAANSRAEGDQHRSQDLLWRSALETSYNKSYNSSHTHRRTSDTTTRQKSGIITYVLKSKIQQNQPTTFSWPQPNTKATGKQKMVSQCFPQKLASRQNKCMTESHCCCGRWRKNARSP